MGGESTPRSPARPSVFTWGGTDGELATPPGGDNCGFFGGFFLLLIFVFWFFSPASGRSRPPPRNRSPLSRKSLPLSPGQETVGILFRLHVQ